MRLLFFSVWFIWRACWSSGVFPVKIDWTIWIGILSWCGDLWMWGAEQSFQERRTHGYPWELIFITYKIISPTSASVIFVNYWDDSSYHPSFPLILVLVTFGVSVSTPFSFSVYRHQSMGTRSFLVVFLVFSSLCHGNPGVNWENSSKTPSWLLIWSGVIRGKTRKVSGSLLVFPSFTWKFPGKLDKFPYNS